MGQSLLSLRRTLIAKHLMDSEAPVDACKNNRQKKTEVALCLFYSSLSGVQTGIPSGPSGGIPSPSVGSELRLCRPFATLFYLSTLPTASPSLPSAVGHSSVAVGIGNITKSQKAVNTFFKKNSKKFEKNSAKAMTPVSFAQKLTTSLHQAASKKPSHKA